MEQPFMNAHMQAIGGAVLKVDHTFKLPKVMCDRLSFPAANHCVSS